MQSRVLAAQIGTHEGTEVTLKGWIGVRRDHGKIIFIDLRDRSGLCQCVILSNNKELFEKAQNTRHEFVIEITGDVNKRPEKLINNDLESGKWEVLVKELTVLSESETPPISIDTAGYEIGEENRLKYRYLDLRRSRLNKNIRIRHKAIKFIRDYLDEKDFTEVETPIITKSTPEGARDYVVPSRTQPGKFFALPQSPQQYKQLLMTAGLERYFQIAKCFRDEDTRGDRQPEFTQLDLEMSFVKREDVMGLIEDLYIQAVEKLFPHKKIAQKPFPRMTYKEAMEKYGSDRPDLRKNKEDQNELCFLWVIDFPFFEKVEEDGKSSWTFTHNPFSAPIEEHREWLMKEKNIGEIITTQYDLVLNGFEIGGGSIRNHQAEALKKVLKIMGHKEKQITENFGHMLSAFSLGTPPHGGIAMGLDRFIAIMQNEPNIREVIAFPKTGDIKDPMMDSPSIISPAQLKELGLSVKKTKKKGNESHT